MKYDLRFMNKTEKKSGFTLVELLVVIAIISILTIISVSSFRNAQIKAKDAQRKADLNNLSKALMMYYNDNGKFPAKIAVQFGNESVGLTGTNGIIYMRKVPKDPINTTTYKYVYEVNTGLNEFNLFANLENTTDLQCKDNQFVTVSEGTFCYGISSPNSVVKNWQ